MRTREKIDSAQLEIKDTVVSIDEQILKYTTAKGKERVWKRVKN